MKNQRQFKFYSKAQENVLDIYKLTKDFPPDERFGLISQLQRAAVSVSANIAEGCGYDSTPQFHRFLNMALGSVCEVDCLLEITQRLKYGSIELSNKIIENNIEVKKMIYAYIKISVSDPAP